MAETDISKIARQAADMLLAEASTLESTEVEPNAELISYLLGTDKENRAKRVSTDILGYTVKMVEFKDIFSTMESGFYIVTHGGAHLGLLLCRILGAYNRQVLITTATENQLNEKLKNGFDLDKVNLYRSNHMNRWELIAGDGMLKRVPWSGERVSGVTVNKVSYQEVDAVVLYTSNEGTDYFVGRKGSIYCNNWLGSENYQTGVEGNALLCKDVLYVSDKEMLVSSEDQKHALHVSDGKRGSLKRVAWSGERVQSPHVIQGSTAIYDQIDLAMFSNGTMYFVAKQGTSYYENWTERDNYQLVTKKPIGSEVKLHADVLYVSDKEVLVSSEDQERLVSLTKRVWTFRNLLELTTSSTETEVAEALGVKTSVDELIEVMKTYSFIDEEYSDVDGERYLSCHVDFWKQDGVYSIAVEMTGSRRVITIDEKIGTNHITSIENYVYKEEPTTEIVVKPITPRGNTCFLSYARPGWQPVLVQATVLINDGGEPRSLVFGFALPPESNYTGESIAPGKTKSYGLLLQLSHSENGSNGINLVLTEQSGTGVDMQSLVLELVMIKKGVRYYE